MGKKFVKEPSSLIFARTFIIKSPEETLADGLRIAVGLDEDAYISWDGLGDKISVETEKNLTELEKLACMIISDLRNGRLGYLSIDETNRRSREKATEESKEEYAELDGPITDKQIGYIAGLTKKLDLDRYNLPPGVSLVPNYKDLTEGQAITVIDTLLKLKEGL